MDKEDWKTNSTMTIISLNFSGQGEDTFAGAQDIYCRDDECCIRIVLL